jgi:hypothetical protein
MSDNWVQGAVDCWCLISRYFWGRGRGRISLVESSYVKDASLSVGLSKNGRRITFSSSQTLSEHKIYPHLPHFFGGGGSIFFPPQSSQQTVERGWSSLSMTILRCHSSLLSYAGLPGPCNGPRLQQCHGAVHCQPHVQRSAQPVDCGAGGQSGAQRQSLAGRQSVREPQGQRWSGSPLKKGILVIPLLLCVVRDILFK